MRNSENESPENRSHHPRHLRYTAVGTASVPPDGPASGQQPMQAPRSMPTAGLPRSPRTPRPAAVSPAPPVLRGSADPQPIHGHPDSAAAAEPESTPVIGISGGEPRPEGGTPQDGVRPVPGWPITERRR